MAEFLAIKNWGKYQAINRSGKWIKDYTQQDDEPELAKLTMFQRGVYQELRRIRGRRGRNTPNDMEFILCAMSAARVDRPRIPCAIRELTACGLLILTDQEFDYFNSSEKENKKETKKENKPKPIRSEASSEQQQVKAIISLPLNAGEFAVTEEDFKLWQELYPAVDVLQELRAMAGWCHANVRKRKTKDGVKKFINSWLARAQNNPRAAQEFKNGNGKLRHQDSAAGTRAAVEAGVDKWLRGKNAVGADHVPGAATAKPGDTS